MTCCEAIEWLHEELRELYPVKIGRLEYDPVEVLRRVDPTAYREFINDGLAALEVDYDCEPDDC